MKDKIEILYLMIYFQINYHIVVMSKNVLRPSQRLQTQKIDSLPKGIANRHLKVLDKCNIAINGKWLKDFLFTNIKKTKKHT